MWRSSRSCGVYSLCPRDAPHVADLVQRLVAEAQPQRHEVRVQRGGGVQF
jgi:hypothetical protein